MVFVGNVSLKVSEFNWWSKLCDGGFIQEFLLYVPTPNAPLNCVVYESIGCEKITRACCQSNPFAGITN